MTKAPTPTDNYKKNIGKTENATKHFDYIIMVTDWARTVSWSNDSNPIGVVKPLYGIQTCLLTAKAEVSIHKILYNVTCVSCVIYTFYENSVCDPCCRTTACNKFDYCKTVVLVAYFGVASIDNQRTQRATYREPGYNVPSLMTNRSGRLSLFFDRSKNHKLVRTLRTCFSLIKFHQIPFSSSRGIAENVSAYQR